MKETESITYIKNKATITKNIHPWNRNLIVLSIFEHPFTQQNNWDYYKIKEDITYLHFKNVTFYRDIKFRCSEHTHLILENCKFKGANVSFIGGHIKLIQPDLPCSYYRNNLIGSDLEEFNLVTQTENPAYLSISVTSKKIKIDGEDRVDHLYLTGKEILIQNMQKLKKMVLNGSYVKTENIHLNYLDNHSEKGIDKNIAPCISCDTLEIKNTILNSCYTLEIQCKNLLVVKNLKSGFASNYDVIIGNTIYKNSSGLNTFYYADAIANPCPKEPPIRDIISILKKVQILVEQESKKTLQKKEQQLLASSETPTSIPTQIKVKKRVKQYEEGMNQHRTLKTYQRFQEK